MKKLTVSLLSLFFAMTSHAIKFEPENIDEGDKVKFSWNNPFMPQCYISGVPGVNTIQSAGSIEFTAFNSMSARLYCYEYEERRYIQVGAASLNVKQTGGPLKFVPAHALPGQEVKLKWNLGSENCRLFGVPGIDNISGSGSFTLTAQSNLTANAICFDYHEPRDYFAKLTTNSKPVVKAKFSPAEIFSGEESDFSWTSPNAQTCNVTGDISDSGVAGQETITAQQNKSVTVSCANSNGTTTSTHTLKVNTQPAPVISASASPSYLTRPGTVRISGNAQYANECKINGVDDGFGASFSKSFYVRETTFFKITCTGSGGESTRFVGVLFDRFEPPY